MDQFFFFFFFSFIAWIKERFKNAAEPADENLTAHNALKS